jgi:hypothetical protein
MTYEYTLIYSRTNTDTPFYTPPEHIKDYIDIVWRADGIYTTSESMSDDGFVKIIVVTFKDTESWLQFIDDPIIKSTFSDRNAYHIANDITVTRLEG